VAQGAASAYHLGMAIYELRKLKRGHGPLDHRPDIRPSSDRELGSGSELFDADDDDGAAARGETEQQKLGAEYIVSVYETDSGERRMVYPREPTHA
jgi:hypothetical protein